MEEGEITIRAMVIADHAAVMALLHGIGGVVLRDADTVGAVCGYLARNPGLSLVAEQSGRVVGCIMAGHDGRRGYLQHLAVAPAAQRRGLATRLVDMALAGLAVEGIGKAHIDVLATNDVGMAFWERIGWTRRRDIIRYSIVRVGGDNA